MTTLFVLCGLPFSGKSTIARVLSERLGAIAIDVDSLARERGDLPEEGIEPERWGRLFAEAHQLVRERLGQRRSVVFDAVNVDRAGRDRLREIAHERGARYQLIYVAADPLTIAERRANNDQTRHRPPVREEDLAALERSFEVPTEDEDAWVYTQGEIDHWLRRRLDLAGA